MSFKKRVNGSWADTPNYIHNTFTDTITTLPIVIYTNDTTATVGLKGQMEQSSTPTPDNPITPSECGDLETVGVKAGQYKIPISSAGQTTTVYLGEVETTRKIKKLVLTGEEDYKLQSINSHGIANFYYYLGTSIQTAICSHLKRQTTTIGQTTDEGYLISLPAQSGKNATFYMRISSSTASTVAELKSYLATQYAAGTPITVWYVLAEPTTGIVNEPLRKIGYYADTVSGITIPTIAGANTIDVDTTLKPSEMSVNYHGWHPMSALHRFNGTSWD